MNHIIKYFSGVAEEAKRVRWPNQKTLWKSVAVVLVIAIVAALATVLSDYLAVLIFRSFEIAIPSSNNSSTDSSATEEAAAMLIRLVSGGKF